MNINYNNIILVFIFCIININNISGLNTTTVNLNVANSNSNYQIGQECGITFTCNSISDSISYYNSFADIKNQPLVIHLSSDTTFIVSALNSITNFNGSSITIIGSISTIISGENLEKQFINLNNNDLTYGISTTLQSLTFTSFNNEMINFGQKESLLNINNCVFINNALWGRKIFGKYGLNLIVIWSGSSLYISNSRFESITGNSRSVIYHTGYLQISNTNFENIQNVKSFFDYFGQYQGTSLIKISNCNFNNSNSKLKDGYSSIDIEYSSFNNFIRGSSYASFLSIYLDQQLNIDNCKFNNIEGVIDFFSFNRGNYIKQIISNSDFKLFGGIVIQNLVDVSITDSLLQFNSSYESPIIVRMGGILNIKSSAISNIAGGEIIKASDSTVRMILNEFYGDNEFTCLNSSMVFVNNKNLNPSFSCQNCQNQVSISNEQYCLQDGDQTNYSLSSFNNISILLIFVIGILSIVLSF